PDGRRMNLHDLETFVSIAQLGGVTRAAGQLHRSQPAITRRIKLLEGQLGAPLVERGRGAPYLPKQAAHSFLTRRPDSQRSRTERRRCRPCKEKITARSRLRSWGPLLARLSWNSCSVSRLGTGMRASSCGRRTALR